jgi:hypothetical protein
MGLPRMRTQGASLSFQPFTLWNPAHTSGILKEETTRRVCKAPVIIAQLCNATCEKHRVSPPASMLEAYAYAYVCNHIWLTGHPFCLVHNTQLTMKSTKCSTNPTHTTTYK